MIFFPYRDDNPTRSFPLVNWVLIAANIWVFFAYQLPLGPGAQEAYFANFGFIPAAFFGQFSQDDIGVMAWEWGSVVTSMFSHGGLLHLFGNMLFLYLYGDNMEDALGKVRYLLFYLASGFCAAIAQSLINPLSEIPMVGASGAISGVIAGYLLLYPRANIRVFYWVFLFVGTLYVPAYLVLGLWVFEQIIALPESMKQAGGVAIAAHLGGFAAGFVLTPFLRKPGVRLFQDGHTRSFTRQSRGFR
jgi:membrane associated rhomboid family serine protease